jgi:hypothetical protein
MTLQVGFDPKFPSSYEPRHLRTGQLTKEETKRYPETNGWGYYLHFKDDPKNELPSDVTCAIEKLF